MLFDFSSSLCTYTKLSLSLPSLIVPFYSLNTKHLTVKGIKAAEISLVIWLDLCVTFYFVGTMRFLNSVCLLSNKTYSSCHNGLKMNVTLVPDVENVAVKLVQYILCVYITFAMTDIIYSRTTYMEIIMYAVYLSRHLFFACVSVCMYVIALTISQA